MCIGEEQGGVGTLWMGFWASYEDVAGCSSLMSGNGRIERVIVFSFFRGSGILRGDYAVNAFQEDVSWKRVRRLFSKEALSTGWTQLFCWEILGGCLLPFKRAGTNGKRCSSLSVHELCLIIGQAVEYVKKRLKTVRFSQHLSSMIHIKNGFVRNL